MARDVFYQLSSADATTGPWSKFNGTAPFDITSLGHGLEYRVNDSNSSELITTTGTFHPIDLIGKNDFGGCWIPAQSTMKQDLARATPATANTDPVYWMDDLGPQGWNMSTDNTARRPLYNGSNKITFDGTDDWLRASEMPGFNVFTIVARMVQNSGTGRAMATGASLGAALRGNTNWVWQNSSASPTNIGGSATSLATIEISQNGTSLTGYRDGSSIATITRDGNIGARASLAIATGVSYSFSAGAAMDVYGVFYVNRILNAAERTLITNYMGAL